MPELTAQQIVEAQAALSAMDEQNQFGPKTALQVGRILRKLEVEVQDINKERQKIIRRHQKSDESGAPVLGEDNQLLFEDFQAFETEIQELNDSTIVVEYVPITFTRLVKSLPKKKTLVMKGRWAGILEEAGIIEFDDDQLVEESEDE